MRAVALAFALTVSFIRLALLRIRGPFTFERRALWLQSTARLVISCLGIRVQITGRPPAQGLLVSNHLSYLDIVIFAATVPSCMVAKAEIARWPVFGLMARASGALFVDRSSRASAVAVTNQVAERLKESLPVLFFPEGTSTDGAQVLPFHSRFFVPAVESRAPVTAAAVRYVIEDGTLERELCWFGDEVLISHLCKALGTAGFTAEVHFGEPQYFADRRSAARQTHAEVTAMRCGELVLQ